MSIDEKQAVFDRMRHRFYDLVKDFGIEAIEINNPSIISDMAKLSREICHEKLMIRKQGGLRK